MTIKEKLIAMELLWDDLCKNQDNIASPDWHQRILNDRERAIAKGKSKFVDWDKFKQELLTSNK